MLNTLRSYLSDRGIELVGAVPLSKCNIVRPYKLGELAETDISRLSAIIFAIPYFSRQDRRNISAYATSRDYHLFAKQLFSELIPDLKEHFAPYEFIGFADNSPISEVPAAAMAGLGVIGDNMMLITEKYSSYVFLGEIITDHPIDHSGAFEILECEHCGRCRKVCPMENIGTCLSALTQKKGELEPKEAEHIAYYGSAWGCDICQEACPHTKKAMMQGSIYSKIDFFNHHNTPYLTSSDVMSMTDEQFAERAYSWRGRNTIIRNLKLLEKKQKGGDN